MTRLKDAPHLTRLYDLWEQFWVCRALHIIATLGIADLLAEGPFPVETLAQRTATHPERCTSCCASSPRTASSPKRPHAPMD